MEKRAAIGIDLGTSNSAAALFAPGFAEPEIVETTQLVSAGRIAERPLLASATYIPGQGEFSAQQLELPWPARSQLISGALAREAGAINPDRLVSSAKSWLCFHQVDPEQPILPWRSEIPESKISPVEASAQYLSHLLSSLKLQKPQIDLAACSVVVTVPASFDEAARSFTLDAAFRAGIPAATLLEEPVAAFYSWIAGTRGDWRNQIKPGEIILICDVGGGTADFTLLAAIEQNGVLGLERIAVGDHILLGGDNMDLALAQAARGELERGGIRLDRWQFLSLVHAARSAKERLLSAEAPDSIPLALPSRGSSLFQKTISASISRQMIDRIVLEGFLPLTDLESFPDRSRAAGLQELGLPFAVDPALSRHLAEFLVRARERVRLDPRLSSLVSSYLDLDRLPYLKPDAVLFNGGVFNSDLLRRRMLDLLNGWSEETAFEDAPGTAGANQGGAIRELLGANLDLAVARGAAFYGNLLNSGEGLRIRTGVSRSYYIGVAAAEQAVPGQAPRLSAVCVVPQGTEEGSRLVLEQLQFGLRTGEPVEFKFFSASHRTADQLGALVENAQQELDSLPSLRLSLPPAEGAAAAAVPVQLQAKVTELGLLELWLKHIHSEAAWRLSFNLRSDTPDAAGADGSAAAAPELPPAVIDLIDAVFGRKRPAGDPPQAKGILADLEERLRQPKDQWELSLLRSLYERLAPGLTRRGRSLNHETAWLNLAGWTLRPGFGCSGDDQRIDSIWRLFSLGLSFPREPRAVVQYWILWRRIGGGLDRRQQEQLFDSGMNFLQAGAVDDTEVIRCLSSLERISQERKTRLAAILLRRIEAGKAGCEAAASALGRLGSRVQLYGGPSGTLAGETVFDWFMRLEPLDWRDPRWNSLIPAWIKIGRLTNSVELNLQPEELAQLRSKLLQSGAAEDQIRPLSEVVALAERDQSQLFGEELPHGLLI